MKKDSFILLHLSSCPTIGSVVDLFEATSRLTALEISRKTSLDFY